MRFAQLIHRPVRVLGGPTARAACGGSLSLTWLPRKVVQMSTALLRRCLEHACVIQTLSTVETPYSAT
jgi:hypothetical protein